MTYLSVIECNQTVCIDPRCDATSTPVGFVISGPQGTLAIDIDGEGRISRSAAMFLVRSGFATWEGTNIFDFPELAHVVFSDAWELVGLVREIERNKTQIGLDVGCGFGRMLLPLIDAGFQLDGVDQSLRLLRYLKSRLPKEHSCRLMCANLDRFAAPETYGYAFAAMNTTRYLETRAALRAHFNLMHISLLPNSPYLINVTLTPDPLSKYRNAWDFHWNGERHTIVWAFDSYCYVRDQIVDQVTIYRSADRVVTHEEYQLQAKIDLPCLVELLGDKWTIDAAFDTAFRYVELTDAMKGTHWLRLIRMGGQ